jgi:hypothetical protein
MIVIFIVAIPLGSTLVHGLELTGTIYFHDGSKLELDEFSIKNPKRYGYISLHADLSASNPVSITQDEFANDQRITISKAGDGIISGFFYGNGQEIAVSIPYETQCSEARC